MKTFFTTAGTVILILLPDFTKAASLTNSGCVLQQYSSVKIVSPGPKTLKYGESTQVGFIAVKKNGRTKSIGSHNHKFNITVVGGSFEKGTLTVVSMPEQENLRAVRIKIKGKSLGKTISDSLIIPLNFKAPLHLDFSGKKGENGKKGKGRIGAGLFGRDGEDGGSGGDGENGKDGKNIHLNIRSEFDSLLQEEIFLLEVKDGHKKYFFRWMEGAGDIVIESNGGNGGSGGNGGRGGNGKDGEYIESKDKYKDAGQGGDAGDGGNGGNGGNGGQVYLQVDRESVMVIPHIAFEHTGGYGGDPGMGSDHPGRAGKALENQYQPSDGEPGYDGQPGTKGQEGSHVIEILKI